MSGITEHIAKKIKELRVASGLTQGQLARKIHVTPNTVSRWESGEYKPKIEDLERLSRVLDRPLWAFMPGDTGPATEDQKALLSATGDLPSEDIEEMIRYAEFVRQRRTLRRRRR